MAILVTGGAGYIGSHTVVELLESGAEVVVIDNLCNSSEEALKRVERITGKSVRFYQGDIRDASLLDAIFQAHPIDAAIHFAGLKAVGESVAQPLRYYDNNVNGTLVLCEAMARAGVFNLVFSSSATVYGDPASLPISEEMPIGGTTNPYGTSKYMVERVLVDLAVSEPRWNVAILRYFNPVGAHPSGLIGEDPNGIPNNLMPFISQVAVGKREALSVFGNDYDTHDGTGVRDYIHVVDLAQGHLKALERLTQSPGVVTYNLGTGCGYSVLDMVKAFEAACGKAVPYVVAPRRPGDIAACYADPSKARDELGWEARFGVEEMARDSWNWQSNNPNGY
ncbi:UDP-glucose 4-epimerase GalE [Ferrimonas balearica]|uniref:UDP-glucose 4-epimerase GalE n=1 Tax=Ferrimonas balearica TaxID=44012 RepID=UPI001C99F4CD|nr:UDP-glucose 4-epimerase GalE [Ferrimonas balearica]MBY5921242.1 UDP-glucose 4-epimerase GalE [Ferrimonas balearica]MBY5996073.1 UDP-glucose 4-epimerase GalE [Ferrimonas balearica]